MKAKTGKSVLAWVSWEGTVPLSEHERRQFEQIEAALRSGDPRFAEAVRAADPRVHYRRRVIAAALGFLAGVGLLLAGVVVNVVPIAVAGFVVTLQTPAQASDVRSLMRKARIVPLAATVRPGSALLRSIAGKSAKPPAPQARPAAAASETTAAARPATGRRAAAMSAGYRGRRRR